MILHSNYSFRTFALASASARSTFAEKLRLSVILANTGIDNFLKTQLNTSINTNISTYIKADTNMTIRILISTLIFYDDQ